MKNMQYNHYLWPNHQNRCTLQEIGVEQCDVYVKIT